MTNRIWTAEEEQLLREQYKTSRPAELAAMLGCPVHKVYSKAKIMRLTESLVLKKIWTAEEEQLLRERYPDSRAVDLVPVFGCSVSQVYGKAKRMGLSKSAEFMERFRAESALRVVQVGVAHRIKPGSIPPNKGLRRPGYASGRMAETQFKPGRRPRIPIGGHRLDAEGFLCRRVTDTGYNDWKFEHRLLWEEANGPIPKGYKLAFRDGDRKHVSLGNLELLTDAEMMRRNSFRNNYPPEICEVIDLRRQLSRAIRRRERAKEQDAGPERSPIRNAGGIERRREADGTRPSQGDLAGSADHHQLGDRGGEVPEYDGSTGNRKVLRRQIRGAAA